MNSPRVAIVYDRVNKYGGAERVLEALHEVFPEATLFTSVYNSKTAPWARKWTVRTSFLQRLPFARTHHELFAWLMPLAFESFDFSEFELVISVTSEAAKGVITKPGTRHICYLLTPTRYLWNKAGEYKTQFAQLPFSFVLRPFYAITMRYLRWWDIVAAQRPEQIVPISHVVSKRVAQYYKREASEPVYPPVNLKLFQSAPTKPPMNDPYYLIVSRLVPYKRVDLAIQACLVLQRHLVIVGTGTEERTLRMIAGYSPLIHFLGYVTDTDLVSYYQHCTALLYPAEEDYGISAVESLAAGRPAVVYAKSGNAEVIEDGKTGIIMQKQSTEELVSAMQRVEAVQWEGSVLKEHAKRYDKKIFNDGWRRYGKSS